VVKEKSVPVTLSLLYGPSRNHTPCPIFSDGEYDSTPELLNPCSRFHYTFQENCTDYRFFGVTRPTRLGGSSRRAFKLVSPFLPPFSLFYELSDSFKNAAYIPTPFIPPQNFCALRAPLLSKPPWIFPMVPTGSSEN
jgi:hypothetical protein